MDTGPTPVAQLRACVLIVDDEQAGVCLPAEALRRLEGLLESLGFIPLVVRLAESLDPADAGQRVRSLLQTRELFAELAAECLALEGIDPNQQKT